MAALIVRERLGFVAEDLPSPRAWRRGELEALRRHYPAGGAAACLPHLPNRTKAALRQRAHLLGVRLQRKERA